MITDEQSLAGARTKWGRPVKTYDDGFGPLWVYQNDEHAQGIVRAQTWEDAYEAVLDEILTPVPLEDIQAYPEDYYVCERDYHCDAPKDYAEGRCGCLGRDGEHPYLALAEGYQYMPNFGDSSGIVSTGYSERLEELTPELLETLEFTLDIEDE